MGHHVVAHIDLQALRHNVKQIQAKSPQSKILAVVKANAYGHGANEVSKNLEPYVAAFGVMFLDEALKLYHAGIKKPIIILSGYLDRKELNTIDKCNFESVIHNKEQISILESTHVSRRIKVWLKIDTGMHRLGFQPSAVAEIYKRLISTHKVSEPLRFMTHFSDADDKNNSKTNKQIACFEKVISSLKVKGSKCLANSSAILNWSKSCSDLMRPGITLHGVSPLGNKTGLDLNLKPVMTLTSRLIAIHELHKGETVGYGSTWVCPEDMRIGIISVGYGHGYPRGIKKNAPVLINGIRCPLVGRIAMDMSNVDLRQVPDAKVGDQVILWGQGLPIEEIAAAANTVPYELFCRLTTRVFYKYYRRT